MQGQVETPIHHRHRSEFVRRLVQCGPDRGQVDDRYKLPTPKVIVQFWHDRNSLPDDVAKCIASWEPLGESGVETQLFDVPEARRFISDSLGEPYVGCFDRCYHPAMQADYFRLCYLWTKGGFYIDADDMWTGEDILWLFEDSRLKLQPLCYDAASASMVEPELFLRCSSSDPSWTFYFNNNPLASGAGHPVVGRALERATAILKAPSNSELPEIQSTTGPGNLTRSIFELVKEVPHATRSLNIVHRWEAIAVSQWPLSYRNDSRNWRLSNQKRFD